MKNNNQCKTQYCLNGKLYKNSKAQNVSEMTATTTTAFKFNKEISK